MWPNKEEEERKLNAKRDKEKKAIQDKSKAEEKAINDDYQKKRAEWEASFKETEHIREKKIDEIKAEAKKKRKKQLDENYQNKTKQLEKLIEKTKSELAEAQGYLAPLGFFKFGEKSRTKATIERLSYDIQKFNNSLSRTESTYKKDLNDIDNWLEENSKRIIENVENLYPLPPKPLKPRVVAVPLNKNDKIMDIIYEWMVQGEWYTIDELAECFEFSKQKITAVLSQLLSEECVEKKMENGGRYYRR